MKNKTTAIIIGLVIVFILGAALIGADVLTRDATAADFANLFVFGAELTRLQKQFIGLAAIAIILPFVILKSGLGSKKPQNIATAASTDEPESKAVRLERFLTSPKTQEFEQTNRTTPERERDLAFGAVLLTQNWESSRTLLLMDVWQNVRQQLDNMWSIKSPKDAVCTMEYLAAADNHTQKVDALYRRIISGQMAEPAEFVVAKAMLRQFEYTEQELKELPSLAAWDYGRCAFIARYSLGAEYIDAETAWKHLRICAENAAGIYHDWQQYLAAYVLGRALWGNDCRDIEYVVEYLLKSPNSPFHQVKF